MKAAEKQHIIDFYEVTHDDFFDHQKLKQWVQSFGDNFNEWFKIDYDPIEIKLAQQMPPHTDVHEEHVIIRRVTSKGSPWYKTISKNAFHRYFKIIELK